jgi:predicted acyl esterase
MSRNRIKRVGMIGSSYDGWTVTMALLGPHPALKVAAPESPMIDGWMGDDWFHYGAFRQVNLDYFTEQTSKTGKGDPVPRWGADDYQNFLDAGSAGNWADKNGFQQLGFWNRLSAHPAYDAFWQGQALDTLVAAHPVHSHHVAAGVVGPGGYVWRHPHLGGPQSQRDGRQ